MDQFFDIAQLKTVADSILQKTVVLVNDPLFWLQFAVIAVVFFVARWFLTPLLRKVLLRLTQSFRHVPNFQAPIRAFSWASEYPENGRGLPASAWRLR